MKCCQRGDVAATKSDRGPVSNSAHTPTTTHLLEAPSCTSRGPLAKKEMGEH